MKSKLLALLGILVLIFGLSIMMLQTTLAQNVACYGQQGGAKWVASSGCEYEFQSGSTLDVQSGTTFSADTLTVDTDLTVDDTFNIDDTDSTVVGAQTITPTYSYLQVSPATVLTLTLGVPATCDGDILIVHNLVTTSTTVVDTGATAGGGNITLGQDDLAGLICGDGVWVEMFSPDNS